MQSGWEFYAFVFCCGSVACAGKDSCSQVRGTAELIEVLRVGGSSTRRQFVDGDLQLLLGGVPVDSEVA